MVADPGVGGHVAERDTHSGVLLEEAGDEVLGALRHFLFGV